MHVRRREHQLRTGLEQSARVGVEEVGIAPDLVNRPPLTGVRRLRLASLAGDRRPDQMVEDEQATDRLPIRFLLRLAHFLHLDRGDVAILGQAGWRLADRTPPVGRGGLHRETGRGHDQIGRSNLPLVRSQERERRRHISGVAARGAAVGPLRNLRDLFVAEGDIALVALNAHVLLDEPGRHPVRLALQTGSSLHRPRPRTSLLVCEQRHRRDGSGPMTALTAALQDRRNVLRERHPGWQLSERPGPLATQG